MLSKPPKPDPWERGFGFFAGREIAGLALRDLPLPVLVLRESALAHNLAVMARWCAERGVSLAPHGKTTMAPELIRRQLAAGAWGMTAASVPQLTVMRDAGARRVILANQLVGAPEIAWFERAREGIEAFCLVDSVAGVRALAAGVRAPLGVLIELGGPRAGCRTVDAALAVADAVAPPLVLAGVEGFEGTLPAGDVDPYLARLRELVQVLDGRGAFARVDEIVATAGGSAFFDRVVDALRFDGLSRPVRVVLRSGCYLTHDDGVYAESTPLPELRAALELWARVLSCPEPGLAIAGFGKRDAPYDLGLPVVRSHAGVRVDALNDQHAFLHDPDGVLAVGDTVVCGISHPCTAFDKWPLIGLVDDDDVVLGAVRTRF
ncbi:MAG TPA: alanine racemase [Solirubrobacteraceae bacterium]|jgi:D-serine dehydratase|nr:alanine racemase [Solirubrobacteraceae bacterium]